MFKRCMAVLDVVAVNGVLSNDSDPEGSALTRPANDGSVATLARAWDAAQAPRVLMNVTTDVSRSSTARLMVRCCRVMEAEP